jgi:DNA mismatch repair protein MutS
MMRQYKAIKVDHQDAILFFRLGDFYEMFLDDAQVASKILDLTLTGRGKDETRIPMCGIPYHAADSYITRLVQSGHKVAICEQVEDPTVSKGITKREVTKVVTPGTVLEAGVLDDTENNYLVAVVESTRPRIEFGLAYADVTTGAFNVWTTASKKELMLEIQRLSPKEILIPESMDLEFVDPILINRYFPKDKDQARDQLLEHFQVGSISVFGLDGFEAALPAAWAILDYLQCTHKTELSQMTRIRPVVQEGFLRMDAVTVSNLELVEGLRQSQKKSTVFAVLDHTKTSMGARRMKQLLRAPYCEVSVINRRLDAVEDLVTDVLSREEIRELLAPVYDLERLVSRIVSRHNNPRDCIALMGSLKALVEVGSVLDQLPSDLLKSQAQFFLDAAKSESPYQQVIQLLERALVDDPPISLRTGGVIRAGYSVDLDELTESFKSIKDWIGGLEQKERDRTGIKTLRVGYNKVFGYYFEVTHSNTAKIPSNYIRKQTLTNAERYITPELKDKEAILFQGEDKQKALESHLFDEVVDSLNEHVSVLQDLAERIADLDCLQSLATASHKYGYVRPEFVAEDLRELVLSEARHPVLERQPIPFISNDVSLTKDENRFMLITGPNMAGKSTMMRLVALNVVLAQMGCFVAATSARMSVVDQLFTRIGALDNLYAGQSTFMVEMTETAAILHNATDASLVILDEIGRGTSTFDGISIAASVSEYLINTIGARTLFATHYHELAALAKKSTALGLFTMDISETDDAIVFQYRLVEGSANRSYGVHVADMAGLPPQVVARANEILEGFEAENTGISGEKVNQLTLF